MNADPQRPAIRRYQACEARTVSRHRAFGTRPWIPRFDPQTEAPPTGAASRPMVAAVDADSDIERILARRRGAPEEEGQPYMGA